MNKIIPRRSDFMSPFNDLMQDFVDRFFDDEFDRPVKLLEGLKHRAYPKINISRQKNNLVIEAGLPGITRKNVKINFEGNMLWISGKTEDTKESNENDYFYKELSTSEFSRAIELPADMKAEQIEKARAKMDNGILRIEIPYKGPEPATTLKELPIEEVEEKKD
jgi:HSP20 family protein